MKKAEENRMKRPFSRINKDRYGGCLVLLLGLAVTYEGKGYSVGTLSDMGPGYFPVALGIILAIVGALIAMLGSNGAEPGEETRGVIDWRGWSCILLGIAGFVVLGQYGGLVPATFAVVFISALGDRNNTVVSALVLALALVAVCVVVFWWALQLQMPLFQWGDG
jgi:Tripartite tricarboxylate transporter TctB family